MRKPRPLRSGNVLNAEIQVWSKGALMIGVYANEYDAGNAERLAAWLLEAAAWIREQEGK